MFLLGWLYFKAHFAVQQNGGNVPTCHWLLTQIEINQNQKEHQNHKMFCLFELIINVPVNSYGHVGTLPNFMGILSNIRMSLHTK